MKLQLVIVALTALLMPAHGDFRQCAGAANSRFESTGFLTAQYTQNACAKSGGSIVPSRRGNQKCCNVPDARKGNFDDSCNKQQASGNYRPLAQPC